MERDIWIGATTDDGYEAEGYRFLLTALAATGWTVYGAAPQQGLSSQGTSWQCHTDEELGEERVSKDGTPVRIFKASPGAVASRICGVAVEKLNAKMQTCLVAGVNHGPNVGSRLIHSGTFGAALVAAWHCIPAVAVSLDDVWSVDEANPGILQFAQAAQIACRTIQWVIGLGHPVLCNVNVPNSIDLKRPRIEAANTGGYRATPSPLREDTVILSDGSVSITVFSSKSLAVSDVLSRSAAAFIADAWKSEVRRHEGL